jgi:murein DD-endopeptidase MepM/ murein hydrolase activator NlpD
MTSGANVVKRVALENSINPRLLLSLLEYQSHWVYGQPADQMQSEYPMGLVDPNQTSLYEQLVWTINHLSVGYYSWREGRLTELKFSDGITARLAPDLNAGSAAVQYYFAQFYDSQRWVTALDPQQGFPALHEQMYGSPWERAEIVEPLYPPGLDQPPITLPFRIGDRWAFTGGPHGAWEHDGSYAALDFAPPSIRAGCVESNVWVTAAASGLVMRSGSGVVVLDLDGDGYEQTGWVLTYLHVETESRIPVGSWVDVGTPLGHPSCEGGFSTGTHVHIARKYNGEWIAAAGPMPFNLSGWAATAGPAAYKGELVRGEQTVIACTCSSSNSHIWRTPEDPH